jgi:hypothetical protein
MMLDRLLSAPINLYYDITPTSRITSVFNRELYGIQISFYQIFGEFFQNLASILFTVVMALYVAPYLIFVILYMVY